MIFLPFEKRPDNYLEILSEFRKKGTVYYDR